MEKRIKASAVVGLDIGGTFIKAGLVDPRGRILARWKRPTQASSGKKHFLDRLTSTIQTFEEIFENRVKIDGVGIGIPGIIDLEKGVIAASPNFPGWRNFPVKEMLRGKISKPFFLENDANAAALGEMWMGSAKGARNFCFITLGTGVGGGLVLNGEVWHGMQGMAGEVGHMTVDPAGPLCLCGNRGCLEALASAKALREFMLEDADSRSKFLKCGKERDINGRLVYEAARKGDRAARRAFVRMGTALGISVSNLVNLLNLEKIILGGGLLPAWEFFIPALRMEMKRRAFPAMVRKVKVVRAKVGEDAGILGAAYLAWRQLGKN